MVNSLHLYNRRYRKLSPFAYPARSSIGIYVCGPTVYGPAHLGHARSAITFDLLYRYLNYLGYQVTYVRNITDVGHLMHDADEGEDKIIAQAIREKRHPMAVAQYYTNSYRADMEALRVLPPTIEPSATGHIVEQIAIVEKLLAKGFAYEVNGSVYFDVKAYSSQYDYGVLSGRKVEELMTGTRQLTNREEKKDAADFALWKKAPKGHIMRWPSPWGEGFPGWHIECTAMSNKYLGSQFAIHGGGLDLTFPHHDCEIAQAVGFTGEEPADFWMHHNLVQIGEQKMSKSAGNFITLQQIFKGEHRLLSQSYDPMVVRFFLLHAHYRSPIVFTDNALQKAAKQYTKLLNGWKLSQALYQASHTPGTADQVVSEAIMKQVQRAHEAMNDDLNTPEVIAALFELHHYLQGCYHQHYESSVITSQAWEMLHTTYQLFMGELLGFSLPEKPVALVEALLLQYRKAKEEKQYSEVDAIRNALKEEGIVLQDTLQGVAWNYLL